MFHFSSSSLLQRSSFARRSPISSFLSPSGKVIHLSCDSEVRTIMSSRAFMLWEILYPPGSIGAKRRVIIRAKGKAQGNLRYLPSLSRLVVCSWFVLLMVKIVESASFFGALVIKSAETRSIVATAIVVIIFMFFIIHPKYTGTFKNIQFLLFAYRLR